ncbi:GyrI-like domain-containing protein [Adhaeribacter radiodurans]|uniref:GyrI-like domain-containing protein n=1 Tax=Adhaeribacter radiodurans TaxID=2745197 RepID=A0A7L7L5M8_9BACT|nr:GyrI-like domain-containing protein [Adhaeribacter radiodurans]QMU28073.1 GyrI-like domain-containing protein [Adhaeribacter radiodurans]
MEPRIEFIAEKKLIGKHLHMSFAHNRTAELWRSFMPQRYTIKNKVNSDLISMQVYDSSLKVDFSNPQTEFEKWAAVEVSGWSEIPEGMESFLLPGAQYAVFTYKGAASNGEKFFRYIFKNWLPASDYLLDNRPHFEILGEKYKNEDPDSEEEIYIPIKLKV